MNNETKNSKILGSFSAYCKSHPDQRFWQALRNWSGFNFIYASMKALGGEVQDTFHWDKEYTSQNKDVDYAPHPKSGTKRP